MQQGVRNTILACVAFMALVLGLFVNNVLHKPGLSDEQLREQGVIVLPAPRELAPFELSADDGSAFTREDLEGHWSLVYFGFTSCPDICPTTLATITNARRALVEAGAEELFDVVLVSVDPERDTPEALREYLAYFDPDYVGVTGETLEIASLAEQMSVGFAKTPAPEAEGGYLVDHTGHIVVVNPRGHYAAFIRMPHSADQIRTAWQALSART